MLLNIDLAVEDLGYLVKNPVVPGETIKRTTETVWAENGAGLIAIRFQDELVFAPQ